MIKKIIKAFYKVFMPPKKYAQYIGVKFGKNCFFATKNNPGSDPPRKIIFLPKHAPATRNRNRVQCKDRPFRPSLRCGHGF